MNKCIFGFIFILLLFQTGFAQNVSVSPSRFYYKVAPGGSKAQTLRVTNASKNKQSFQISFGDFEAQGAAGKTNLLKSGESVHSLSKYVSANPSFFELEPGQSKEIQVLLELPNMPEASKVKWGTLLVKLVKEKTEANKLTNKDMGMGIMETFQFVIHLFQTPPNVTNKSAEIVEMKQGQGKTANDKVISIVTKNTGEAILDCASYVEMVNLKSGKKERLKPTPFTLLPGGSREIKFAIPTTQEKGKYTVTGVVDYGSKDDVQAAEMDLEL
jgi:P pilus assembly chaperone PapD